MIKWTKRIRFAINTIKKVKNHIPFATIQSDTQTRVNGRTDGETRSVRGGDWYSRAYHKRCSRRGGAFVEGGSANIGFRCVGGIK